MVCGNSYFDPFAGKDLATLSDQGPFVSGTEGVLELDVSVEPLQCPETVNSLIHGLIFKCYCLTGWKSSFPKVRFQSNRSEVVRLVVSPSLERLHRDLLSVPVGYA